MALGADLLRFIANIQGLRFIAARFAPPLATINVPPALRVDRGGWGA